MMVTGATAQAAWPDDVVLSQLGTWEGENFSNADTIQRSYSRVIQQLGVAIGNSPVSAAESSGLYGFDIALTNTVAFTDSTDDGSPWQRVHEDTDPSRAMWMPGVTVRKGLPMSLEAGARMSYVALSRQSVFGAWGKATLLEGYRSIPDLAIQVGYSSYVGNTELALGTMDLSAVIGKTFPFGRVTRINTAQFSPYIGGGLYRIRATPRLDESTLEDLGIAAVSGFTNAPEYTEGYAPGVVHLGMRIVSGDAQFLLGSSIAPNATATVTAGLGYVY
jgi:hypothetical protein